MATSGADGASDDRTNGTDGNDGAPDESTDGWVGIGVIGALVPVVALHLMGAGRVDLLSQTVSDYVALPWGGLLLAVSALGLVLAGARVAHMALRGRLPGARSVAWVGAVWVLALVLVATFPTNVDGAPPGTAAVVHRWAGAVVLALPPVLALLVARGAAARGTRVTGLAVLTAVTAVVDVAFLLSHVPIVVLGSPGFPLLGLVERVLYALVIALLPVMSTAVRAMPARAGSTTPALLAEAGAR